MKTYDLKDVKVSIGDKEITGFDDGGSISIPARRNKFTQAEIDEINALNDEYKGIKKTVVCERFNILLPTLHLCIKSRERSAAGREALKALLVEEKPAKK